MANLSPRKIMSTVLKLSLVGLLLFFLGKKGLLSVNDLGRILEHPQILLIAFAGSFASMVLAIIRWRVLLRGQDIHLGWWRTVQLSLIGNFFNLALPGAVSGDLVKAFYIAKDFPGKRGHAFGSILFDRIVGVSGLVLVSAGAMLLGFRSLHDNHVFQAVQWFVGLSGLGVLAFFSYLFFLPTQHDPVAKTLGWLHSRFGKIGSLQRIYEGVRNYHAHRGLVAQSLLLSCLIHLFAAGNCVLFTYGLDSENSALQVLGVFALAPLGLLTTAVPLAPAGVGTGHAAFSWLFLLLGYKMGANVFSLVVGYQMVLGALGGFVYLKYRSEISSAVSGEKMA